MNFKFAFHSVTGRRMVEVYDNADQLVAAIYPNEETGGIHIVSKHIDELIHSRGGAARHFAVFERELGDVPAPSVLVRFNKPEQ